MVIAPDAVDLQLTIIETKYVVLVELRTDRVSDIAVVWIGSIILTLICAALDASKESHRRGIVHAVEQSLTIGSLIHAVKGTLCKNQTLVLIYAVEGMLCTILGLISAAMGGSSESLDGITDAVVELELTTQGSSPAVIVKLNKSIIAEPHGNIASSLSALSTQM